MSMETSEQPQQQTIDWLETSEEPRISEMQMHTLDSIASCGWATLKNAFNNDPEGMSPKYRTEYIGDEALLMGIQNSRTPEGGKSRWFRIDREYFDTDPTRLIQTTTIDRRNYGVVSKSAARIEQKEKPTGREINHSIETTFDTATTHATYFDGKQWTAWSGIAQLMPDQEWLHNPAMYVERRGANGDLYKVKITGSAAVKMAGILRGRFIREATEALNENTKKIQEI